MGTCIECMKLFMLFLTMLAVLAILAIHITLVVYAVKGRDQIEKGKIFRKGIFFTALILSNARFRIFLKFSITGYTKNYK